MCIHVVKDTNLLATVQIYRHVTVLETGPRFAETFWLGLCSLKVNSNVGQIFFTTLSQKKKKMSYWAKAKKPKNDKKSHFCFFHPILV